VSIKGRNPLGELVGILVGIPTSWKPGLLTQAGN